MPNCYKLATQSDLPAAGEAKEFPCGDKDDLRRQCERNHLCHGQCLLASRRPLGQGVIEGDKVVCPWHGWQWDPKTGQAAHNPGAKVTVYPLKVEGGDVMIEI